MTPHESWLISSIFKMLTRQRGTRTEGGESLIRHVSAYVGASCPSGPRQRPSPLISLSSSPSFNTLLSLTHNLASSIAALLNNLQLQFICFRPGTNPAVSFTWITLAVVVAGYLGVCLFGLNLLHRLHLSEVICFALVLDLLCVPGVCTQVQKRNLRFFCGLEYFLVFLNYIVISVSDLV